MAHCVCGSARWDWTENLIRIEKEASKEKDRDKAIKILLDFSKNCVRAIEWFKGKSDGKK